MAWRKWSAEEVCQWATATFPFGAAKRWETSLNTRCGAVLEYVTEEDLKDAGIVLPGSLSKVLKSLRDLPGFDAHAVPPAESCLGDAAVLVPNDQPPPWITLEEVKKVLLEGAVILFRAVVVDMWKDDHRAVPQRTVRLGYKDLCISAIVWTANLPSAEQKYAWAISEELSSGSVVHIELSRLPEPWRKGVNGVQFALRLSASQQTRGYQPRLGLTQTVWVEEEIGHVVTSCKFALCHIEEEIIHVLVEHQLHSMAGIDFLLGLLPAINQNPRTEKAQSASDTLLQQFLAKRGEFARYELEWLAADHQLERFLDESRRTKEAHRSRERRKVKELADTLVAISEGAKHELQNRDKLGAHCDVHMEWSLIGGERKLNDPTPLEAARREAREEIQDQLDCPEGRLDALLGGLPAFEFCIPVEAGQPASLAIFGAILPEKYATRRCLKQGAVRIAAWKEVGQLHDLAAKGWVRNCPSRVLSRIELEARSAAQKVCKPSWQSSVLTKSSPHDRFEW